MSLATKDDPDIESNKGEETHPQRPAMPTTIPKAGLYSKSKLVYARNLAAKFLQECRAEGKAVTDEQIRLVLSTMVVDKNVKRRNVMPEGTTYVRSDLFGASKARGMHYVQGVSQKSMDRFHIIALCNQWLLDRLPENMQNWTWSSITINRLLQSKTQGSV